MSGTTFEIDVGAAELRYFLLSAHYRQPLNISDHALKSARKAIRRLLLAAEPAEGLPPVEIIECLADDLNTPAALALCHKYRASGRRADLFRALRFLGFLDCTSPSDVRLIPHDHLPPHEIFGGIECASGDFKT